MNKIFKIVALVLTLTLLAGCGSTGRLMSPTLWEVQDVPGVSFVFADGQWYGVDVWGNYVPFTNDELKSAEKLPHQAREDVLQGKMVEAVVNTPAK